MDHEASLTWQGVVCWLALSVGANAVLASAVFAGGEARVLPDASLPLIAYAALRWPVLPSVSLACAVGAATDLAAAGPNGLMATSVGLAAWLTALLRWRWFGRRASDLALASALLYGLARSCQLLLLLLAHRPIGLVSWAEATLVPGLVLHAGLGLAARRPLEALWRRLARPQPTALSGAGRG